MLETLFAAFMIGVWGFALAIGINPVLGARIGLWLQGHRIEEPEDPPAVAPDRPRDKHLGNNIDRFV